MDEVKTTTEIDNAIESTAGTIIGTDTVAIWSWEEKLYGVYVKGNGEALWWLQMTTLNITPFMENKV